MRRPRRLVLSAAALGLAVAASGCAYINPVQTHEFYQAGDGTNASLTEGDQFTVGARNMIVLVADDGTAELLGTIANYTGEEITAELEGTSEDGVVFSDQVPVPAQGTVELGDGEGEHPVAIDGIDVPPGSVITLTLTVDGQSVDETLPVTDTSLEHFEQEAENGDAVPAG